MASRWFKGKSNIYRLQFISTASSPLRCRQEKRSYRLLRDLLLVSITLLLRCAAPAYLSRPPREWILGNPLGDISAMISADRRTPAAGRCRRCDRYKLRKQPERSLEFHAGAPIESLGETAVGQLANSGESGLSRFDPTTKSSLRSTGFDHFGSYWLFLPRHCKRKTSIEK